MDEREENDHLAGEWEGIGINGQTNRRIYRDRQTGRKTGDRKKKPDRWVETGGDEPDGHTEEVGTGGWTDKWTDKRLDLNGTNRRTDGRTGNRRTGELETDGRKESRDRDSRWEDRQTNRQMDECGLFCLINFQIRRWKTKCFSCWASAWCRSFPRSRPKIT